MDFEGGLSLSRDKSEICPEGQRELPRGVPRSTCLTGDYVEAGPHVILSDKVKLGSRSFKYSPCALKEESGRGAQESAEAATVSVNIKAPARSQRRLRASVSKSNETG